MRPAERNALISSLLVGYIERVNAGEGPKADRYKAERAVLERLIPIQTDGFRGIVLTAIMGKHVRSDINTGTEFNQINPRGIFERAIRPVLLRYRIPTGASAPLNVAKNVQVLDEKWAEGRKPEDAARAAVEYIRRINSHWSDPAFRDDLIMIFIQRLVRFASEVARHDVELAPLEGLLPVETATKLARFTTSFMEGGALPQLVAGKLLSALRTGDADYRAVEGGEASVFGTNTTSRKPGDLWETDRSDRIVGLYEVTCKPVDMERLDAAVNSLAKLDLPSSAVTFVCRLPRDVAGLVLTNNTLVHRGVSFQFLDFEAFVIILFSLLSAHKREHVLREVAAFVGDPSRRVAAKNAWAEAFGGV